MKRKFTLVIFYFCFFTFYSAAQPTLEWAARYERLSGSSGIANQMALDKVGNCYVLGNSISNGGQAILIKYNTAGDTLWTRNYIGAANVDVIADSVGNVYITGYIGPSFGPYDIYIIKFNPNGIQQWLKIYDSGGSDLPSGLINDNQGNILMSGLSGNESIIIKYQPNGDTAWTRKYSEPGYRFPARTIDIDKNNNIYIGGGKVNISNNAQNFYVIKYDSNGLFKWINSHSLNNIEILNKVKTDQNYNLYATGISVNGRILTVKYDSSGIEKWQRIYSGPAAGDEPSDIGIDNSGNIIITGYSAGIGAGNTDYVTIKYNTLGDSIWVKRYNGTANSDDEAYSMVLDDSDNIYVTGRSINTGVSWDYTTIKYNPNGLQTWIGIYNNQSANADDIANKIAIDKNNNIYVTGMSDRGGLIYDYLTIKYSQTVGVIISSETVTTNFKIDQNYPNPFNPVTFIKYEIMKNNMQTKLVVYDITGKELVTLVNQIQNKGKYNYEFNAVNFTSGVYFYKLSANEFTKTKKMLLIK